MDGGKRSTVGFCREAARLALGSGRTRREVAEDLGIDLSTLTRWVSQSRGLAEPAEVQADLHGVSS
jgi:transposase